MKAVLAFLALCAIGAQASCPNSCSGHGSCDSYDRCVCDSEGKTTYFGYFYDTAKGYDRIQNDAASSGVDYSSGTGRRALAKNAFVQAQYTGADCSLKTCSRGVSWTHPHAKPGSAKAGLNAASVDMAGDGEGAVLHADFAECSDQGLCDRSTGECDCFPGYEGAACQRTVCENNCNGHGQCVNNVALSKDGSTDTWNVEYKQAWDSGLHMGCRCDVGYRGPDCSQKECPSTADPLGWHGSEQGEQCSGRGLCDHGTGLCMCFTGFGGKDCATIESYQ